MKHNLTKEELVTLQWMLTDLSAHLEDNLSKEQFLDNIGFMNKKTIQAILTKVSAWEPEKKEWN